MLRVCLFSLIENLEPLHIGSGSESLLTDSPVLRNSRSLPFISANALASIMKTLLIRDFPELKGRNWLGSDDAEKPSLIIIDDAVIHEAIAPRFLEPFEVRDSVTIIRDSQSAKPDHQFDKEVIPPGALFPFFCRIDVADQTEFDEYKQFLADFLHREYIIGGKGNSGLGKIHFTSSFVRAFDLSQMQDLLLWMTKGHAYQCMGDGEVLKRDIEAENFAHDRAPSHSSWTMRMKIAIDGGLHMSGGSKGLPEKGEPDDSQVQRSIFNTSKELQKEYADFGTSMRGRFRSAMEKVLRTLIIQKTMEKDKRTLSDSIAKSRYTVPYDPTQKSRVDEISAFFGYTEKDDGYASPWRVSEHSWQNGTTVDTQEDHIRLSEFTQHVMEGAKFAFAPLCAGTTELSVTLSPGGVEWQKELISITGDLLCLNVLPWGGKSSRGYLGSRFVEKEIPPDGFIKGTLSAKISEWIKDPVC